MLYQDEGTPSIKQRSRKAQDAFEFRLRVVGEPEEWGTRRLKDQLESLG